MGTPIEAQVTPQGLLIPRAVIREWLEQGVDVIKDKDRIVIQPRSTPQTERERVLQILEASGLLLPTEPLPPSHKPVSAEEQAELARKFSAGRPLSEIVIEDREDRV
jgi:hypothetical protein